MNNLQNQLALFSQDFPFHCRLHRGLEFLTWPSGFRYNGFAPEKLPFHLSPSDFTDKHPAHSLFLTLQSALSSKRSIQQYVLPVEEPKGSSVLYYLLSGEFIPRVDSPEFRFQLEDITEVIAARRRSAYIGMYHGIIGRSPRMLEVFHRISLYGPTMAPVIITGETGTGKELIARALHEVSPRVGKPFVAVNCTALSPELFESELFGHEKGSFTGALREHKGRFERADGGTLFLDEIGDMPLLTQAKLLRALEEGVIERVGGEREYPVDVRVVAATNVGLDQAVGEKLFRSDLFHRLNVFRIHLPALRERREDIPLLANYFLSQFNRRYNKQIQKIAPEAIRRLQDYNWPGNIRELRNVMERLVVETFGEAISSRTVAAWEAERDFFKPGGWNLDQREHSAEPVKASPVWPGGQVEPLELLRPRGEINSTPKAELTTDSIRTAYQQAKGNLTEAARILGVHKATLYRNMKTLNISREELENNS
ncbi:MAG: sigma-54 dependent transcriptional regulator [Candidatus Sumerlaeia bacterium]|nr:sigma-54 dependent transcriptional regulator [Candidatus Sumerlaeia bacterium]